MRKLNKQTELAISYIHNYLSFLFLNKGITNQINAVYLFGSAARGELEKESDIDIFIDSESIEVEAVAKKSISLFMKSKDYDKWRLMNFMHSLSVQVGLLEKWELKSSIQAEGILLYSKSPTITSANRSVLFTITLPKKKSHYLKFIRSFFGRNEQGYNDKGILGNIKGTKLSATVFLVQKEYQQIVEHALQKQNVDYSFKEIAFFQ